MKKFLIVISLLLATCITTMQAGKVILNPRPNGNGTHNPNKPRSPIVTPEAYLDGHTLTFDASCIGCPLTLVDEEENIVYTTIIDNTGIVELPDTLSGIFELQIVRGSITFVGEIEL